MIAHSRSAARAFALGAASLVAMAIAVGCWIDSAYEGWDPTAPGKSAVSLEGDYWAVAQFDMALVRFEWTLSRYEQGDAKRLDDLQHEFERLQARLLSINSRADPASLAPISPGYKDAIRQINSSFADADRSMRQLAAMREIEPTMTDELDRVHACVGRIAQAIVETRERNRDAVLADRDEKRLTFVKMSVVVSTLFLLELGGLMVALRHFRASIARSHALLRDEKRARQAASDAVKSRNAFLGIVGHELRTPLQVISSAIYNLSDQTLSAQNMRIILRLEEAVQQMERQMRDLGDYAQLSAGMLRFHAEPFDLPALLESVIEQETIGARKKGLVLRLTVENGVGAICSDRGRVRQIVTNLLSNAIRYSDSGEVGIDVDRLIDASGVSTCIAIKDHGRGIPADRLDALFEPFTQLDDGNTRVRDGMGMGLTIVKGLVELLAGQLHVASNVGQGSTFRVVLPDLNGARPA